MKAVGRQSAEIELARRGSSQHDEDAFNRRCGRDCT
jgi:hypothetical protein